MTIKEFDTIQVGDTLSNKVPFTDSFGNTTIQGYDYTVIGKAGDCIDIVENKMKLRYTIRRSGISSCLNLRKI